MSIVGGLEFLRQLVDLTDPARRSAAIQEISELLGVDTFLIFVPDAGTGELLAAPGFPQTLPNGRRWRQFLSVCVTDGGAKAILPWPAIGDSASVEGMVSSDGSVVALVGGPANPSARDELGIVFPLVAAALKGEQLNNLRTAETKFANELAQQSATLALSLDHARRALQTQLDQRRQAEAALQEAQRELRLHAETLELRIRERTARLSETVGELESFSYSIAHDMRAPLRAMEGYARFVVEEHGDKLGEDARRALDRISASATRMDKLIQDVLNYSRIVRGDFKLTTVDTKRLITEMIELRAHWQPPHVEILISDQLSAVIGNEAFLTQCVSNLVENAIKFVPKGKRPRIEIFSKTNGHNIRLCFKDNGIGIDEKSRQRIFNIFEKLHHAWEYEGTGIGLAIVRKAAERMNGKVGVESGEGLGSTFWIELKGAHDDTPTAAR